ncbi:MAG: NAD(P)-dependent oxidoreductase [Desulfobacterales bacterium]|nr:NAD(P)-dependent oxidoreductase [Desulfobacterales bacterium]
MNILVTGADGFVGRHACRYLQKSHTLHRVNGPKRKGILTVDLCDRDEVKEVSRLLQKGAQIDVILHLASKLVGSSDVENMEVFYDNIRITESVIKLARNIKPKKVINISSMAVYPALDGTFSETSQIQTSHNTDCLYGLSKFCSENLIDFMLNRHGILTAHLRISQIIGQGMRNDRVVPVMLKELSENNTITVRGNGERVSNFIHIDKLVSLIGLFVVQDISGIYNVGGVNISYYDLAQRLIMEHGNERSKIIKIDEKPGSKFRLSTDKLSAALKLWGIDPAIVNGLKNWK